MSATRYDIAGLDIAWCPGCGNFAILKSLKQALQQLEVDPLRLAMVSGIGQAAKFPHYLKTHCFNGLHGRALPPATAIKAANPTLTVIALSGDGDMYGEGGNHFIHTIRRNPGITNIVHDNMVYGLTKGQASPTSMMGFRTPVQTTGVQLEPFNPIAVAIALNAPFVARAFTGQPEAMRDILKEAITFPGYALVDILQPCVSFNRTNTLQWFREHTYTLEDSYDPTDRAAAFGKAIEHDRLALGVIYRNPSRVAFEDSLPVYRDSKNPLYERRLDLDALKQLIDSKRSL